jgi:hypothetical protein
VRPFAPGLAKDNGANRYVRGMVRITTSTSVYGGDVQLLEAALPLVIDGLRQLTFGADGNLVVIGVPHSGLRLIAGTHPDPGATYRIRLDPADPSPPIDLEVKHNESRRIVVDGREKTSQTAFTIELAEPWNPRRLSTTGTVSSVGSGWMRGAQSWRAELALPIDPDRPSIRPHAVAHLKHRRFRINATLVADHGEPGEVRLTVAVTGHGRGVVRFLMLLAAPFIPLVIRKAIQPDFDQGFSQAQATLDRIVRPPTIDPDGEATPHQIAGELIRHLVDQLAD